MAPLPTNLLPRAYYYYDNNSNTYTVIRVVSICVSLLVAALIIYGFVRRYRNKKAAKLAAQNAANGGVGQNSALGHVRGEGEGQKEGINGTEAGCFAPPAYGNNNGGVKAPEVVHGRPRANGDVYA